MAETKSPKSSGSGFRIETGPVVRHTEPGYEFGLEYGELPRVYGDPLLFAIPRDPRTLFVYWNVDWASVFAGGEPIDRQVYIRVRQGDGGEESQAAVEPMLGSHYATVERPGSAYQVELGYYNATGAWNKVAASQSVTTPPESGSEDVTLDLATVPFHLSFQRLIDLFRASNGDALSAILSRLQNRAVSAEERALLTPEEWEILTAMDQSINDLETDRRGFVDREDEELLRRRTEAILGFGATSPAHGFGDNTSSWNQAAGS